MNPASGFTEPLIHDIPLPFRDLCERIHDRITQFLQAQDVPDRVRSLQQQTKISLRVIDQALQQYGLPELSLAYNGGKDCLVLLILYLYTLHKRSPPDSSKLSSGVEPDVQCVYIQDAHPFPEVEAFVATSIATYSLSLRKYANPMKAAFADYLRDTPSVKAILVGTRRTDPHGEHLTHFDPTDSGWPEFVRVHPVIDWHYVDIWTFIRFLNIPYCTLYDLGYTSLGGTTDTQPNPALACHGSQYSTAQPGETNGTANGVPKTQFRPAYELIEDHEERLGRER